MSETFSSALAHGLPWAFFSVFVAGIATSLTPCVYPMIPITVSIFGARAAKSRWTAFALASCYVGGIAVMYAGLGVLAALGGWAAGGLLASPWFVVPLSLLFVAMATSMFGLWEIRLPAAWQTRLSAAGGSGYRGSFVLGLVGGVLIAPCTGPVLAGLLAWVATTRNIALGASLLFTYALGIGVLFWLLATFAVNLPKSGTWMNVVKSVFGVALLVAALYYLQNIFAPLAAYSSGKTTFAWLNVALVVGGVAIGALHLTYYDLRLPLLVRKTLGVLLLSVGCFGLINYTFAPADKLHWVYKEADALALAKKQDKPLFIDVWAQWCLPCKQMEADLLSRNAVREELSRFVLFKIDVTEETEADDALREKYKAQELPQLIVIDRQGRERARFGKVEKPEPLLRALRTVP